MYFQDNDYMPADDSDDDDICRAESSDEDIDAALQGNVTCQKALTSNRSCRNQTKFKQLRKDAQCPDEDEFDKEMKKELVDTISALEGQCVPPDGCLTSDNRQESANKNACYDAAYFDSDSDEEGTSEEKRNTSHPVLSNDDLLYDPDADTNDQKWVDMQRQRYQPNTNKKQKLPNSDAILDCPACMVTLCLDCQRHDTYKNQYRAMFVQHCKVDLTETLKFPANSGKRKRKQKARFADAPSDTSSSAVSSSDFVYHPVYCDVCSTHIAMYDADEVYHFFNVLASYS